jgi:cell division protein FtsB
VTDRLLRMPSLRKRGQGQRHTTRRGPSLETAIAVSIALFILFLWLHFVLAQELESVGRQIQERTYELERADRENAALEAQIAETGNQENMSRRAKELGYDIRTPTYLVISEPLGRPQSDETSEGTRPADVADGEQSSSFLSVVASTLDLASETGEQP